MYGVKLNSGSCRLNSLKFISTPAVISCIGLVTLYDLRNLLISVFLNSFSFKFEKVTPLLKEYRSVTFHLYKTP